MESVDGDGVAFPTSIHGASSASHGSTNHEEENDFVVEIEEQNQPQNIVDHSDSQHSEEENSMEYLAVIKQR